MRSRAALALASALALGACGEAKKPPPPPPPTVLVTTLAKRDVPIYIEAVGALDGYVNAEIRARVRGYLRTQDYRDGSTVKAGQMLFTIESTDYAAAVMSAKAALSRARVAQDRNRIQARALSGPLQDRHGLAARSRQRGRQRRGRRRSGSGRPSAARSGQPEPLVHADALAARRRRRARVGARREPRRPGQPDAADHGLAGGPDARELPGERGRLRQEPRPIQEARGARPRMGQEAVSALRLGGSGRGRRSRHRSRALRRQPLSPQGRHRRGQSPD